MPAKPLWLRKALGWSRVALFILDTGSDVYVGVDLIQRCHYRYAGGVFSFFWLPGLLSGGYVAVKVGQDFHIGCCGGIILFLLGTILGPFVFIPFGLYLLVKAALKLDDDKGFGTAKL